MRKKLTLSSEVGYSGSKKYKLGYGGAYGVARRSLRFVGVWSQAVSFVLFWQDVYTFCIFSAICDAVISYITLHHVNVYFCQI
jgi:hypothetical protein